MATSPRRAFRPSPLLRRLQATAAKAREDMARMVPTPGCAFPMGLPLLPTDPLQIALKQIDRYFAVVKEEERKGAHRIDALTTARETVLA